MVKTKSWHLDVLAGKENILLACYLGKSEPLFPVTVSAALLPSAAFTQTLMLQCSFLKFNIIQNSTVISLFCGHSSWNKINFVSRGRFPASKPKVVQENENKAKREQKSGCVADFQLMMQKYFRGLGGKCLNPQIRIFVFKPSIFSIFILLQGADDLKPEAILEHADCTNAPPSGSYPTAFSVQSHPAAQCPDRVLLCRLASKDDSTAIVTTGDLCSS